MKKKTIDDTEIYSYPKENKITWGDIGIFILLAIGTLYFFGHLVIWLIK